MKTAKKRFFKKELRKAFIFYAIAPTILLSFVFYNLVYLGSNMLVKHNNQKYNETIAETLNIELNNYRKEAEELVIWPGLKYIISEDINDAEAYEQFYNIVNKHSIRSIFYVYNSKGEVIITNSRIIPQYSISNDLFMWGIFKKMRDNPKETTMMLNRAQLDINTRTVYSIGRPVLDSENNIIGFVVFDILENQLNKVINSNTSHHAVITDRYNNNIVTSNTALLDSIGKLMNFSEKEGLYSFTTPLLEGNMFVHTVTAMGFIKRIYFIGEIFLILVFTILLITMSVIAGRVAGNKTKAIDQLLSAIKNVQEGNLDTKVSINTNDEFEVIGHHYNEMLVRLKVLIEKNKEEATRSVLSELKQLEAQFNPHFLFNTLEMLKYMIKVDEKASAKVIVAMSNLLRYSINSAYHKVKLAEDIKYIEDYLLIQKYRFEDNFDYSISLQEQCEACIIPKLILQPLIENSIKYGFDTKKYLKVEIKCTIAGDKLLIEIEDNGEGINEEKLSEILCNLRCNDNNTPHIGLYNVHRRIMLMYGESFGIKIYSKQSEGTRVIITLPVVLS